MVNNWVEVRIGDLGRVVTGKTPPSSKPQCFGSDYPFITPSDMRGQKTARQTDRYLSEEGALLLKSNLVPSGSVAVSCIGWQMGKSILTCCPSITNQQLNTIIPNEKITPDFLYYALSTRRRELFSLGSATGVRTPILNKSTFSDLTIVLPPIEIQRKIATILSAYDDLIENNTRRIKVLEEMAQTIYREWFVNFRFPGHEKVKMVDSPLGKIPEGWEVKTLGDFGEVITGKTPSKKIPENFDGEMPFIKTPDMHGNIFCIETTETLSALGVDAQKKKTIPANSLCVSCIGTPGVVTITSRPAQTNQQINSIVQHDLITREFLYFALVGLKETMSQHGSSGATMFNLSKGKFEALQVVCPESRVMERFQKATAPMFNQIYVLQKKNANLSQTRDLLLPKLVSGAIDVSGLAVGIEAG